MLKSISALRATSAVAAGSAANRTPATAIAAALSISRNVHQPPIRPVRPNRAQQTSASTPLGRSGTGPESSLSGLIDLLFRDGSTAKGHDLLENINGDRNIDTVITYNNSIISAAASGDKKLAEKLLAEMKSENLVAGCDAYSALVKVYAKERDWIRVYELLSEMSHCGITRDVHLFNVIIRGFVNGQDMRSAVRSYEEMVTAKQQPNVVTFNTIIEGYATKGWKAEALEWFKKMEDSHVTPNLTSYNLLIELFAKSGDVSSMLSWFGRLESSGLHPDSRTYTSLLTGYTNNPGSISEAFTVWEDRIRTSVNSVPTTEAVSAFLRLCAEAHKPDRALKEWREMRTAGFTPSVANCNELIRTLGMNGLITEAKAVLFDEMRRDLDGDSRPWWMPKPTWKTYVVLLDVASRHGRQTDVEEIKMSMFAHDKALAPVVVEELPQLFGPEERH